MPSCIHRNTSVSCVRPRASFASAAQLRPILRRPRPIPPTFVSDLPAARSSWRHVAIDTIHSSLSLSFPPTQQSLAWIPFAFLLAPGFRSSTCPHPSSPTWCARFLPSRRLRLHPRSFFSRRKLSCVHHVLPRPLLRSFVSVSFFFSAMLRRASLTYLVRLGSVLCTQAKPGRT